MGQYSGYATAEESNQRYRYLIERGMTGIGIAFDLPTQLGLDSDNPLSKDQVGTVGVAVDTIEDMRILLNEIPLEKIEVRAIANAQAIVILAMMIVIAQERGLNLKKLKIEIMNDILKEYSSRGNYIFPPDKALELTADIFEFCFVKLPNCIVSKVCGYHMREAGCDPAQEIAFAIANGMAYLNKSQERGIDINWVSARFRFYFGCHRNIIEEVAKLRAARRLWAKIIKNEFGATDPEAMKMRLFVTSSGSTLTTVEPYNNIVRVAFQGLIGALAGAEVMHLASMDEGHALPTQLAVKTALRTQQIIAYETGVTDSVDPLGGSYMLEALTNYLEKTAAGYIQKIEKIGGAVTAIESGYIQNAIAKNAYKIQKDIDEGEEVYIGINKFKSESKDKIKKHEISKVAEEVQIKKLLQTKKTRNNNKVEETLGHIEKDLLEKNNLMPSIINSVKEYATIGEICNVLKKNLGEYKFDSIL